MSWYGAESLLLQPYVVPTTRRKAPVPVYNIRDKFSSIISVTVSRSSWPSVCGEVIDVTCCQIWRWQISIIIITVSSHLPAVSGCMLPFRYVLWGHILGCVLTVCVCGGLLNSWLTLSKYVTIVGIFDSSNIPSHFRRTGRAYAILLLFCSPRTHTLVQQLPASEEDDLVEKNSPVFYLTPVRRSTRKSRSMCLTPAAISAAATACYDSPSQVELEDISKKEGCCYSRVEVIPNHALDISLTTRGGTDSKLDQLQ